MKIWIKRIELVPIQSLVDHHNKLWYVERTQHLHVQYDLNQSKAVPVISIKCSSLCNKILWSVISKAVLRSRRTNKETKPLSETIKRNECSFSAMVYSKTRQKLLI